MRTADFGALDNQAIAVLAGNVQPHINRSRLMQAVYWSAIDEQIRRRRQEREGSFPARELELPDLDAPELELETAAVLDMIKSLPGIEQHAIAQFWYGVLAALGRMRTALRIAG